MSNKVYDIVKWVLISAISPTIVLITELGELYGFDTTLTVKTISIISTFVAALLGISNYNYYKNNKKSK